MSFEEEVSVSLVTISSIVPVKSNQFNCYLDLIAFPRSGERKQYASLGTGLKTRLWRNFTVASSPRQEEVIQALG